MTIKHAILASFMMTLTAAFVTGCGNACDDATDKVEECGLTAGNQPDECSDVNECLAECANEASCDELKAFYSNPLDAESSITSCLAQCQ